VASRWPQGGDTTPPSGQGPILKAFTAAHVGTMIDAVMTNPPFYASSEEVRRDCRAMRHRKVRIADFQDQLQRMHRGFGRDDHTGWRNRLPPCYDRRLYAFARQGRISPLQGLKYILSSYNFLHAQVVWYTSMLGKKSTLRAVLRVLRTLNIRNVRSTAFYQVKALLSLCNSVSNLLHLMYAKKRDHVDSEATSTVRRAKPHVGP
jgi:23S rRNA A1618 N6-methylase RlmF